jgi:hypothetical protein
MNVDRANGSADRGRRTVQSKTHLVNPLLDEMGASPAMRPHLRYAVARSTQKGDFVQRNISRRAFATSLAMLSVPLSALARDGNWNTPQDKEKERDKEKEKETSREEQEEKKEEARDKAKDAAEDHDKVVDGPGTDRSQDRRQDRRRDEVKPKP